MPFHRVHLEFCILCAQVVRTWPVNCYYFVLFLSVYHFLQCWNWVCHSFFFIVPLHFFREVLGFNRIAVIHSMYFGTFQWRFIQKKKLDFWRNIYERLGINYPRHFLCSPARLRNHRANIMVVVTTINITDYIVKRSLLTTSSRIFFFFFFCFIFLQMLGTYKKL